MPSRLRRQPWESKFSISVRPLRAPPPDSQGKEAKRRPLNICEKLPSISTVERFIGRWLIALSLALLGASAYGQLSVTGELQLSAIIAKKNDKTNVFGQIHRAALDATYHKFEGEASYFWYPVCGFDRLDSFHIAYHATDNLRVRAGRFRPIVGQSGWYDQWNIGFLDIPDIEHWTYFGETDLWQCVAGVEAQGSFGNNITTITAFEPKSQTNNKVFAAKLNRIGLRTQSYVGGWVLGLGGIIDSKLNGGPQMGLVDFRTAGSHWTLRGEAAIGNQYDSHYKGFFLEGTVRPSGQDKLTLLGRLEKSAFDYNGPYKFDLVTLGAKATLLPNTTFSLNFRNGSLKSPAGTQGQWSLGIQRTYTF